MGKQHEQQTLGPAITVLGASVGVDRPMPVDGAIQVAFDRYLSPGTVNRQSLGIVDSANMPLPADLAPIVTYDPIARTVTLSRPKAMWLTQGQSYKLVLFVSSGPDQPGVRAIDGAALFPDQKLDFTFLVGPATGVPVEPTSGFCRDVLPIFAMKCGTLAACHASGERAAASLILDSSAGVGATALNRIAQGSNTGSRSSLPPETGRVFGVDMPIIDPGNPGNSWLMYKIDLAPLPLLDTTADAPRPCKQPNEPDTTFRFVPLAPGVQSSVDGVERSILSDFILGREMPFPVSSPGGYPDTALTFEEREKVRIWIKNLQPGAALPTCTACAK